MRRTFAIFALICSLSVAANANDGSSAHRSDGIANAAVSQLSTADGSFAGKHKKDDQEGKKHHKKHGKHHKKHGKHHKKHEKKDKN